MRTLLPARSARAVVLAALVTGAGLSMAIAGQPSQPRAVRIQSLAVDDNLYLITGGGGNTLALALDTGTVVVDTKLAGWGQSMLDALAGVTDKPVTMIINTHTHGDHTGSNAEFPAVVEIVAHERAAASMKTMEAFQGANARFLPNRTFADRLSLLDGLDQIDLYHFGPGHTDGDTVVVFPAKRVAHMGDLFPSKSAPFIDTRNGGSGVSYPDTLARALTALKDVRQIVTGHTPPPPGSPVRGMTTLADLEEYVAFNRDFLNAVRGALKAGKSADEAAVTLNLPARYRDYGMDRARANIDTIYRELQR